MGFHIAEVQTPNPEHQKGSHLNWVDLDCQVKNLDSHSVLFCVLWYFVPTMNAACTFPPRQQGPGDSIACRVNGLAVIYTAAYTCSGSCSRAMALHFIGMNCSCVWSCCTAKTRLPSWGQVWINKWSLEQEVSLQIRQVEVDDPTRLRWTICVSDHREEWGILANTGERLAMAGEPV